MGGCMSAVKETTPEGTAAPLPRAHVYAIPGRAPEIPKENRPPEIPNENRPNANQVVNASSRIEYELADGSKICINFPINPWEILGLPSSSSRADVKIAFRKKITDPKRQTRVLVSLANHMLTSTAPRYQQQEGSNLYNIKNRDHFTLAACGDAQGLYNLIVKNGSLIEDTDEHGRTLLYLACKSGFPVMVKWLLECGADVEQVQRDGSTSLHGAAYFGHARVVELLLQYCARTDVQNTWGKTALEESASTAITTMIQNASLDPIISLAVKLKERNLVRKVRIVHFKGQEIAKELIRDPNIYDPETRAQLTTEIMKQWKLAWHGTRHRHLESILTKGLLAAGTNGITPPAGHFSLDREYMGIENWASAIFVSPSIWYSADPAYAEKVSSHNEEWCVLIKAYCKPNSYKRYDPTVFSHSRMEGEPQYSEYRVGGAAAISQEDEETVILRVESERNVVVRSVVFIRTSALQNDTISFEEMTQLFKND